MIEALEAYDKTVWFYPYAGSTWAKMGLTLAKLNRLEQAAEALSMGEKFGGRHYDLAKGYAVLGDKDKMLFHLSVSVEEEPVCKIIARSVDEEFEQYHNDEQFKQLTQWSADDKDSIGKTAERI